MLTSLNIFNLLKKNTQIDFKKNLWYLNFKNKRFCAVLRPLIRNSVNTNYT